MFDTLTHEETLVLREAIRFIGDGKNWDALETLRRVADDDQIRNAIELAQFKVEMPW